MLTVRVIISTAVAAFLVAFAIIFLWKRPATKLGKLSLSLCAVNAVGWLIVIMLLPEPGGHPSPGVFAIVPFWLLNLALLPAAAILLWACRRGGRERGWYVAAASAYVTLNVIVLYGLPLIGFLIGWLRG